MNRIPVSSSNLVSVGYDEESETLEIEFQNGIYQYFDVPKTIFEELMSTSSKGRYFNQNIKDDYQYE